MGQSSNPIDIKKTGPLGYRQLWEQNTPDLDRLVSEGKEEIAKRTAEAQAFTTWSGPGYDPEELADGERVESPLARAHTPLGASMFDKGVYNQSEFEAAGDIRAENQPWYAKVGAGLGKAAILAGTTYCQLPAMLLGAALLGPTAGEGLFDNEFTRTLKSINDMSEEWLPNYYTEAEQNTPWWNKIGTANFIGDTFIKNLGFSIGALYSGGMVGGIVRATRLPQVIGSVARAAKVANAAAAPGLTTSLLSAGMMALGEGGVEAINNSTEWADAQRERWDAQFYADLGELQRTYDPDSEEFAEARAQLWDRYNKGLVRIADDAKRMGNADLLMNLPILTISDMIQFGRFLGGGYRTNRMATGIVRTAEAAPEAAAKSAERKGIGESIKGIFRKGAKAEGAAAGEAAAAAGKTAEKAAGNAAEKGLTQELNDALKAGRKGGYKTTRNWRGAVWAGTKNVLSEGNEEMEQRMAQDIAGRRYEYDLDDFYAAKDDPESQDWLNEWMTAFAQGILETAADPNAWEEWAVGGATGALGIPMFRSARSESGKFRSPVTLQGGVVGAVSEYNAETRRQQNIVDYLNAFMRDPKRANYYRGLTRHHALDEAMSRAAADEDILEYKNGEFAQLLSDVMMFDSAGRIDDLMEYINTAAATDDANLKAIVDATTARKLGTDGKTYYIGPYVTKDGTPMYSASEDGRAQMVEKVNRARQELMDVINRYRRVKDDIDIQTGEALSDDQLEQLAYIRMAALNQLDRAAEMAGEVRPYIQNARDYIAGQLEALEAETEQMGRDGKLDEKLRKEREAMARGLRAVVQGFDGLMKAKGDKDFIERLAASPNVMDIVDGVTQYALYESGAGKADMDAAHNEYVQKISDIAKLVKAAARFNEAFNEFMRNPGALREDMDRIIREQRERRVADSAGKIRERLDAAKDDGEFYDIMDGVEQGPVMERLEKGLKEAGSERYARWRDRTDYANAVRRQIASYQRYSSEAKDYANQLLDGMLAKGGELSEVADPGAYRIPAKDMSVAQTSYGLSALRDAIRAVNRSERYRTRFGTVRRADPKRSAKPDGKRTEGRPVGTDEVQTVDPVVPEKPAGPDVTPTADAEDGEVVAQNMAQTADVAGGAPSDTGVDEDEARAAAATAAGDTATGGKDEWVRAIPQMKEGTSEEFADAMERESGGKLDFHRLYDYLKSHGAFAYVNSGKLRYGDRIGFMIDPEFPNTIFIITNGGQVIGSMFEKESKLDEYGMRAFVDAVWAEYESRPEGQTGVFVSKYTSEVTAVYDGKVMVDGDTEAGKRDLSGLMDWVDGKAVMPDGTRPLLAVYGNGSFKALPDGVKEDDVKMHGVLTPGAVMILVPTASGRYIPMQLGVRKFSDDDMNFGNTDREGNPVMAALDAAIGEIVDAAFGDSADGVTAAVLKLKDVLSEVRTFPRSEGGAEKRKLYIDYNPEHRSLKISFRRIDGSGNDMYRTDEAGNRLRDENGNELADERTVFVNLTSRNADIGGGIAGIVTDVVEERTPAEVRDRLERELMKLGLTFRVDFTRVNDRSGYNDALMRSGVLTTYMRRAECVDSFYHFAAVGPDGTVRTGESAAAVVGKEGVNALGGPEGAQGTVRVDFPGGKRSYEVDTATGTIYNARGERVRLKGDERSLVLDLAWARKAYGDTWNSSQVYYGQCVTPGGRVLDMRGCVYLGGEAASRVRSAIKGHKGATSSDEVIGRAVEAQKRVDKEMTDGSYYYVMEEDGRKHRYTRVSGEVAGNTEEEENIRVAVRDAAAALMNAKGISEWNTVLAGLSDDYGHDFKAEFGGKPMDGDTALAVAGRLRDVLEAGRRNAGAREGGRAVSELVRSFFTARESDGYPARPDGMSERAYNALMDRLVGIRENMLRLGERFHSEGLVVFHRYADGRRVAGTIDILAVDRDGNFKIYDIRSSELSAHTVLDRGGKEVNYFTERADGPVFRQNRSSYEQKRLEMSALKNLFESEYGVPVTTMAMIPVRVTRNGKKVVNPETGEEFLENTYIEGLEVERGIGIEYMEDCGVPREGAVERPKEPERPRRSEEEKKRRREEHGRRLLEKLTRNAEDAAAKGDIFALADCVVLFEDALRSGAVQTPEQRAAFARYRETVRDAGYEFVSMYGMEYDRGMKLSDVEFYTDESLPEEVRVITGMRGAYLIEKGPDGKPVRFAKVRVAQGASVSAEENAEKRRRLEERADAIRRSGRTFGEMTVEEQTVIAAVGIMRSVEESERRYNEKKAELEGTSETAAATEENDANEAGTDKSDAAYETDPSRTIFNPACETMVEADQTLPLLHGYTKEQLKDAGYREGFYVDESGKVCKTYINAIICEGFLVGLRVNEAGTVETFVINANGAEVYKQKLETNRAVSAAVRISDRHLGAEDFVVNCVYNAYGVNEESEVADRGRRTVLNALDSAPKGETSMSDVEGEVEPDLLDAQEPGEGDFEIGESDLNLDDTVDVPDSTPGEGAPESQSPRPSGKSGEAALEIEDQLSQIGALNITSDTTFADLPSIHRNALEADGVTAERFDKMPLIMKKRMLGCQ